MKKSYYAIIPANVRYDKDLTDGAKLLYGEITALSNQEGYCWASNKYFSDLYGKNSSTITRWINQLIERGYIKRKIQYKEGTKEIKHRYLQICIGGTCKNAGTPPRKNARDNNTVFNNTSNSSSSNAFAFYENNFGMMSPFISQNIEHWIDDLSEELVIESMKIALTNNKQFNYAEGILRDWYNKNIRTIDDVEAARKEFERKRNPATRKREVADFEID